jgi:hypothetical protein
MEMKQTDDRHSDIMGPSSGNFGGANQTGTLRSNATQFTSLGSTMAPPTLPPPPPVHQGVVNGSIISAPVFMPQQQRPQQQMFLGPTPSQSMGQLGQASNAASTIRMVSQPYLPSTTPMPMGYPNGPLPQTPKAFHMPQQQFVPTSPGSISSAQQFQMMGGQQQQQQPQQGYTQQSKQQIMDSPQLSSSGRGSGRTTDDSTDSGMSIPRAPTPPSQPLFVPKTPHKLVPGRMTTSKERKREIPSTAV